MKSLHRALIVLTLNRMIDESELQVWVGFKSARHHGVTPGVMAPGWDEIPDVMRGHIECD